NPPARPGCRLPNWGRQAPSCRVKKQLGPPVAPQRLPVLPDHDASVGQDVDSCKTDLASQPIHAAAFHIQQRANYRRRLRRFSSPARIRNPQQALLCEWIEPAGPSWRRWHADILGQTGSRGDNSERGGGALVSPVL